MQITKLIETEISTPITAGTATSLNSATCVRLCNNTAGAIQVSISTSVGAATSLTFTIPPNSVEFLQKLPTDVLFSVTTSVKANKVGFTN
jgi:hypothetical protein